jgi:glycosyltransferase involved in cell wall biosynthesis
MTLTAQTTVIPLRALNFYNMRILMSHPTGNSNVRAVITALSDADMLADFYTTLAVDPHAMWLKFVPKSLSNQLLRRTFPISSDKLSKSQTLEALRLILPKVGLGRLVANENSWASIDSVYQSLDRSVVKKLNLLSKSNSVGAVYGYEDGALHTFRQAKKLGLKCIYDLPIAYWETSRKLLMQEAKRLPAWAGTLGGGINDSAVKLQRKTEELELADVVIAPSEFVLNSLPDWAREKCLIHAPFGSPVRSYPQKLKTNFNSKLRLLFVGSMTQRKGLADLFEAMRILNRADIELIVMGSFVLPTMFYRSQLPGTTFLSTRTHNQVLELMASCDVFCLPSIVEGRALVMQEAMAQGLPIIITANTGGEDLVQDGKTGFLVPIRAPEAIAEKLLWLLENRAAVPEMGRLSYIHSQRYSWQRYGSNIASALTEFDNGFYNSVNVS